MKEEDKQLLLTDLSARLPYGVKIFHEITNETDNTHTYDGYILYELSRSGQHITLLNYDDKHGVCEVDIEFGIFKPYLRSITSITEEENKELEQIALVDNEGIPRNIPAYVDWLNSHHFDFRGLIPMGLALKATKDMYKL